MVELSLLFLTVIMNMTLFHYNLNLLCLLLILLLSFNACMSNNCSSQTHNATPLYLLSLLPYQQLDKDSQQPRLDTGRDLLPAVQLAVEYINCEEDLLKGYKLVLIEADGGCDIVDRGVESYVKQVLYSGHGRYGDGAQTISGIIGPACLESASTISSLTNRPSLRLPNIHLVNSLRFQSRTAFPLTFGILGSSVDLVETVFTLMKSNGWMKISLLYEVGDPSFLETVNYLKERIHADTSLGKLQFDSPISDNFLPVEDIAQRSARIIVVLASTSLVQKVMCHAYKKMLLNPTYQWMILGNTFSEIKDANTSFTYEDTLYNCSNQELTDIALKNSLFINYSVIDHTPKTDVGINYREYSVQYRKQLHLYNNYTNYTLIEQPQSTLVYDAVWALAFALNTTMKDNRGGGLSPNVCFGSNCGIASTLSAHTFQGISGYIDINNATGYNQRRVNIFQVIDSGMERHIGQYLSGNLTIFNTSVYFLVDTNLVEYVRVKWEVAAFFTIVTLIQLVIIIGLHIISIVNRNYKSIKATNPKLHHLVFTGCYLIILSEMVFVWALKTIKSSSLEQEATVCLVTLVWLLPLSWTLIFATLTAHAWRLYRIFTHFTNPGQYISDWALYSIISVQLGIDLLLATLWSVLDPTVSIPLETSMVSSEGIPIITTMCVNNYQFVWFTLLLAYKMFQISVLFLFCVLTKNIKAKGFTTSNYKVASYLICTVFVVLTTIYTLLYYTNAEIHADFVVYCVHVNSILFLCTAFILFPPVFPLLRERLNRKHNTHHEHVLGNSSAVFL